MGVGKAEASSSARTTTRTPIPRGDAAGRVDRGRRGRPPRLQGHLGDSGCHAVHLAVQHVGIWPREAGDEFRRRNGRRLPAGRRAARSSPGSSPRPGRTSPAPRTWSVGDEDGGPRPAPRWIALNSTRISSRSWRSSADSGSSSSRTSGSMTIARASAMRCCRAAGKLVGSRSPTGAADQLSARVTRVRISSAHIFRYFSEGDVVFRPSCAGTGRSSGTRRRGCACGSHVVDPAGPLDQDVALAPAAPVRRSS